MKRIGIILILSGPSGAGKSTVCNKLISKDDKLNFSISCTTRKPREGEKDGVHYYFLEKEEFENKIKNNDFLEWAEVHGNYYGTLISEVLDRVKKGYDVILDIDVQGARIIRELTKTNKDLEQSAEYLFVAPPSFQELENRLRGRGTETEEVIQKRLTNAQKELSAWREYENAIVLETPEQSVEELEALIISLRNKSKRIIGEPFDA